MKAKLIDKANDIGGFSSSDETREVLRGVHFTENFTEATDGRVIIRVPYPAQHVDDHPVKGSDKLGDVIVPSEAIKRALGDAHKNSRLPVLETVRVSNDGDGCVVLGATDLDTEVRSRVRVGQYPNTDTVIPSGEFKTTILLSPDYLGAICAYASEHIRSGYGLKIETNGPVDPVKITFPLKDGRGVLVVLMPMRP